jgi:hypothetical protein
MLMVVRQFIASDRFFFLLPTFLSLPVEVHVCTSFFFSIMFFYCFFSSLTLLEKFFYVFNSVLKLQLVIYILVLPIQSLFFWFVIVTLESFVKVLLVFNCILKSKFILVFFFQLAFILLICFSFVNYFFFFI